MGDMVLQDICFWMTSCPAEIKMFGKPKGLCEISQAHGKFVLVCLGLRKGQFRVEHYASKRTKFILAHDSRIVCFALAQDRNMLAMASNDTVPLHEVGLSHNLIIFFSLKTDVY
ncbi:hypothetical protein Hdeb2414_s0008g00276041 [Helianthus debilis subsp. tardiflorus]